MLKQTRVLFTGQVQGVGFRYTTERVARHFEVTGYVRNLKSGQVELVAEGEEPVLQDFLKALRESPVKPYIRNVDVKWFEAEGKFSAFGIAY